MVYPYLTYYCIIWRTTYPTMLKLVFTVQKKVVRIMTFAKYQDESRPFLLSLNHLNIYELNVYI